MATSSKHLERQEAENQSSTEISRSDSFRRAVIGLVLFGIGCLIVFWMPSRRDDAAIFDRQIDEGWMTGRDLVDAQEFFRSGGVYENIGDAKIDQLYVVPLIDRLREEHNLNLLAVLNEPQAAFALIAEVPSDRQLRNEIRRTVLEMDEQFSGMILQSWGHNWLSLDFLEEPELEPLRQAKALQAFEAANRRLE